MAEPPCPSREAVATNPAAHRHLMNRNMTFDDKAITLDGPSTVKDLKEEIMKPEGLRLLLISPMVNKRYYPVDKDNVQLGEFPL